MIFTYEKYTLSSIQAHEYVSLEFTHGTIRIRSVDSAKSVSPTWDAIGTYEGSDCEPYLARFTEDSFATQLAAKYLTDNGTTVEGATFYADTGRVIRLAATRRMTRPESIRGRVRDRAPGNKRDKRARIQRKYGKIGEANVAEMRAERDRILAERNAK